MSESAIRIEGVTRSFGRTPVLKGVTASAASGKVVGLLGRNGEGKTTLFKILLDMLAMDSGEVEVLGERPDGTGVVRRLVGYVPERPGFHEFMTIGEVLELRAGLFPGWKRGKARDLCRRLGLELGVRIRGASKGTLGKIAWVCAAAHEPKVFLLDEPTSGLDALVRDDVLTNLIAELHDSGSTFIIANHRMEELSGVLDEIWVLSGGGITEAHSVEDLRTQARRVTARLKDGADVPSGLPVRDLKRTGPLVECAVLERGSVERIEGAAALESVETAPMPIEETLKVLLKGGEHA